MGRALATYRSYRQHAPTVSKAEQHVPRGHLATAIAICMSDGRRGVSEEGRKQDETNFVIVAHRPYYKKSGIDFFRGLNKEASPTSATRFFPLPGIILILCAVALPDR